MKTISLPRELAWLDYSLIRDLSRDGKTVLFIRDRQLWLLPLDGGEPRALTRHATGPSDPQWTPDFGPLAPHPTAGATAVGARPFLIAYNVNLATAEVSVAFSPLRYLSDSRKT